MRITHVRGYDPLRDEPGDEPLDARLRFTGIALADLENALREDHDCQDFERRHCDICTAIDDGFVLSALRLLSGATECPATDRVCYFHGKRRTFPSDEECETEWNDWVEWYRQQFPIRCPECRTWNRADETSCHACRTELPVAPDTSEE